MQKKGIRAEYDANSITVYQAYRPEIAESAIANQKFISPPFKKERMTWIKPSFMWMMYRSGWAGKLGQEYILAIKIKREGFEWALNNSCLSHFDEHHYSSYEKWRHMMAASPVRIQWDPERDVQLQPMEIRSLQIGLSGIAVEKYVSEWILEIQDITPICTDIRHLIADGKIDQAMKILPIETIYPLPENIGKRIGASD